MGHPKLMVRRGGILSGRSLSAGLAARFVWLKPNMLQSDNLPETITIEQSYVTILELSVTLAKSPPVHYSVPRRERVRRKCASS